MSKRILWITFPIIILVVVYFVGPQPATPVWSPDMPVVPSEPAALDAYVASQESHHKVKPDNEARIVWYNDSTHARTPYALIYLHGFTASQEEGNAVHRRFAKEFGCNLYLARMADHGLDTTDAMLYFTPDRWWQSAREALAIGKAIGEKVIIMSTSTGGTMALMLAAHYPEDVYALINMSPNIAINNGAAFILNDPWGLQIARMVTGGNYRESQDTPEVAKYWYSKYRIEATVQLEEMVESSMNKKTFSQVKQPCLTLYYYKNEQEQDPQVKVSAILNMMDKLATPPELKRAVAIPNAGGHVLGCDLVSKDVEGVYRAAEEFAIQILKLPKTSPDVTAPVAASQP